MKHLEEFTWDELIDFNRISIHLGLLEGGGEGMKTAVSLAMMRSIEWSKIQQKHKEKENTNERKP